ncbi:diaminopimelate decarboxylase [Aneurinibacillus tyrosinisolvens]|uniref:diaminopimelate decarboxylase n=1 Tax=Aneurinibacillus tyrosinisolvens TaxID=1443435 RepID=UPI00063F8252|nr:diaminopimelate decarboxylase [Aneurinibacillus tyrosinisolvens]
MFLHGTSTVNKQGHLEIGGCDTLDLVEKFGTPLFVYDEELIRQKCRNYIQAFKETGHRFRVAYASKAFCTMKLCKVIEEENLCLDVVSAGELFTALAAGFPAERIHFHGNNKTRQEIQMALEENIGCFVVDNFYELTMLADLARKYGETAHILLRVTPGVECHTHQYMVTGQQDSKFGFDIKSGQAYKAVSEALQLSSLHLLGLHSHIGSQIFETRGFEAAIECLAEFLEQLQDKLSFTAQVLNVGGGFGIRYHAEDIPPTEEAYIKVITDSVHRSFTKRAYPFPEIWIEPGRTIVGEAGMTLYTVGSIKEVEGIRKYVSVDGGMTDNLRPALYQAKYEAILANRINEKPEEIVSIAGKCCESGDMLIWNIELPKVNYGDILAVSCTGAYGYAMASNYNRIPRPAVVFVKNGEAEIVVKRETYKDLIANEYIPEIVNTLKNHSYMIERISDI